MVEFDRLKSPDNFVDFVLQNTYLKTVFERIETLQLKNYYVGGGAVCQTIWNAAHDFALESHITDIDIVYFDPTDLSYEAENKCITLAKQVFADLPIQVDLKNQARVHLWYKEKFGYAIAPYPSVEAAINSWPTTSCSVAMRLTESQDYKLYAPFGLDDLLALKIKPNKQQITKAIYDAKLRKWLDKWPLLNAISWDDV